MRSLWKSKRRLRPGPPTNRLGVSRDKQIVSLARLQPVLAPRVGKVEVSNRVYPREELSMRIWDAPPSLLWRQHLLGEHRELHGLWCILTEDRRGYAQHPETRRWRGKLAALYQRHEALTEEKAWRGYRHASRLDQRQATGSTVQNDYVDPQKPSSRFSAARAVIAP